jgi:hypothetical protein
VKSVGLSTHVDPMYSCVVSLLVFSHPFVRNTVDKEGCLLKGERVYEYMCLCMCASVCMSEIKLVHVSM